MTQLDTTDAVIDALGGTKAVSEIVSRAPQSVSNWRNAVRGKFPSSTYLVLLDALKQKNLAAPTSLWGLQPARADQ